MLFIRLIRRLLVVWREAGLYQVSLTRTCRGEDGAATPSDKRLGSRGMGSGFRDLVLAQMASEEPNQQFVKLIFRIALKLVIFALV